ncbi:UNVERIFIED_CONTAM: Retrovirus-related Pol polyprotein from transposon gypsy [Sesamum radiatum]|uniref:Retrovirus-related Pol polyprotein from transposon gypsy n=1 Tax=Sesamum radiatum TaxID=300843 RepID=A0AAW2L2F5_SESRA
MKKAKPERIEPVEKYKEIELVPGEPEKTTRIGSQMAPETETLTIDFLRKNRDIFAWSPSDFQGIDPQEEVAKLLKGGYFSEIEYSSWLSNVVIVLKASEKWRFCTDFTDLNKACPKDLYSLPRINLLVDSTTRCALFSMMDAYLGYHQIFMAGEDKDKTSFITEKGVYCYNVMPFGLKNAGTTYQRLVNRMFKELIGSTMEVYVDDMFVKSKEENDPLEHLEKYSRSCEHLG